MHTDCGAGQKLRVEVLLREHRLRWMRGWMAPGAAACVRVVELLWDFIYQLYRMGEQLETPVAEVLQRPGAQALLWDTSSSCP